MPIGRVVARVHTRLAEVGYFVVLVARLCERIDKHVEERQAQLFVHLAHLALLQAAIKGGALFVGEVIGRDMLHIQCDGLMQIVFPLLDGFAREAIHQVDADVLKILFSQTRGGHACYLFGVSAIQYP